MENKNTLVALILMLIVWTGFTFLFPHSENQSPDSEVAVKVEDQSLLANSVVDAQTVVNVEDNTSTVNTSDRFITFENDVFEATISVSSSSLVDLKLKDYKRDIDNDSDLVSLLDKNDNIKSLVFYGNNDFSQLSNAVFESNISDDHVIISQNSLKVDFYSTVDNYKINKRYIFYKNKYDFDIIYSLKNTSTESTSGNIVLSLSNFWSEDIKGNRLEFVGPVYFSDDELTTIDVEDIDNEIYSNIDWSGFENKYFFSAVIGNDKFSNLLVKHQNNYVQTNLISSDLNISNGQQIDFNTKVFYGPKDVQILKGVDDNLVRVVDYGFFKILAKPLHTVLNFFYGYIGNYGFSIILLTVIIKMLFWPLTQKSYVSMKAMQKIQPEMKKLREKYGNDRESLNRKMMELYREHRVNPLGGCLPMLVQIPVFFALYKVLLGTIELRHAPFIFWITDLSVKDPYYITPLVMGLTMFIQQKLTPNTMDPMQAKMMLAMPVVFTFLFLNFPAGLVVYWLVNNLLTIFQQYLIYKKPA
ncbi:membrane protein insertase YidC [uncultured Desulfuromonas sp.]|uniref:membrane protein insertase YidC n=1 Tax=uncultured Desulfuromonas sp. TaxID=181013 RepID=UPI002AAA971A|nr:membrane protein insertase YidC [uncultured Desulfuromonas sp.]